MREKPPPGINPEHSEVYNDLQAGLWDVSRKEIIKELERLLNTIDHLRAEAYRRSGY